MLLLALLFFQQIEPASSSQLQPLERLAQKSDSVQLAECISLESHWNEKRTKIITIASFRSQETLKGETPLEFRVAFFGGSVGKISQVVVGLPFPTVGERAILFLGSPEADGSRRLLGGSLGLIPVSESPHGPLCLIQPSSVESLAGQAAVGLSLPLDALLAQLRSQK